MSEFLKGFGKTETKKPDPFPDPEPKIVEVVDRPPVQKPPRTKPTPRKPRESYKQIDKWDLTRIIEEAIKEVFPTKGKTRAMLKKNLGIEPFGGTREGGGGWNGSAYRLIAALVESGKLFIKQ